MNIIENGDLVRTWVFDTHEIKLFSRQEQVESDEFAPSTKRQRTKTGYQATKVASVEKEQFFVACFQKGRLKWGPIRDPNRLEKLLASDPSHAPKKYQPFSLAVQIHKHINEQFSSRGDLNISILKRIERNQAQEVQSTPLIWRIENSEQKLRKWTYFSQKDSQKNMLEGILEEFKSITQKIVEPFVIFAIESQLNSSLESILPHLINSCYYFLYIHKLPYSPMEQHEFREAIKLHKVALANEIKDKFVREFEFAQEEFSGDNFNRFIEGIDLDEMFVMVEQISPLAYRNPALGGKQIRKLLGDTTGIGMGQYFVKYLKGFLFDIIRNRMTEKIEDPSGEIEIGAERKTLISRMEEVATEIFRIPTSITYPLGTAPYEMIDSFRKPINESARSSNLDFPNVKGNDFQRNMTTAEKIADLAKEEYLQENSKETISLDRLLMLAIAREQKGYMQAYRVSFAGKSPLVDRGIKPCLEIVSRLGKRILSEENWTVTLFTMGRSFPNPCGIEGGHAMICVEGVEKNRYFRLYSHFKQADSKGRTVTWIDMPYSKDFPVKHSRTWSRPSVLVKMMRAQIDKQIKIRPKFNSLGENCLAWAIGMCKYADIFLPKPGYGKAFLPDNYVASLPEEERLTPY